MKKSSYGLLFAAVFAALVIIPACGGGGGGGGAVYPVNGVWQLVASNSPQAVIGARIVLASDGGGNVDLYGVTVNLVWAQDGNVLSMTFYDSGSYYTSSVRLSWQSPDKFTWKSSDGTTATYVRVGYARSAIPQSRAGAAEYSKGTLAQGIGIKR